MTRTSFERGLTAKSLDSAIGVPSAVLGFFPVMVPLFAVSSIGLTESTDRDDIDVICDHLAGKSALILLDNCEHLIDKCSEVVDQIRRKAPDIRFITTSREPLLLAGETVVPVPPLSVPEERESVR